MASMQRRLGPNADL
ncbi:hypothetical protein PENCOP_c024G07650 [Penicillium coprophilum]|uniref:Uncharacterized protein n=2 Tax=Penicillium TaxID=5073 RepID=A0A1V6U846_9EURO|nr:hypothetical protein N7472_011336 [Penicillium cf. griseofulvum]OQE34239.1 hypothetical protein PENCOP_c024G07650 [Penicillium coprophilum]